MLFTDKYRPHNIAEVIGNPKAIERVKDWANRWQAGERQEPILLYGQPGVGKTALAYAVAEEMDWEVIETNASDMRSKWKLESLLGPASLQGTLTGRRRLIIIDEVDGIDPTDRGAATAITNILSNAGQPIILIANDPYARRITPLRGSAEFIEMRPVDKRQVFTLLKRIAEAEKMSISDFMLKEIADASHGDVRSALIDLQSLSVSQRHRELNIFKALSYMFKSESFNRARSSVWNVELDPDTLLLWIDENIPREYEKVEEIHAAYESLSRSDMHRGRIIRRQNWKLLRYAMDAATAGVSLAKRKKYRKFTHFQFPVILMQMSRQKKKRATMKTLSKKIAASTHTSSADIRKNIPLTASFLLQVHASEPNYFKLEEDEASLLEDISKSTKIGKLVVKASKTRGKSRKTLKK